MKKQDQINQIKKATKGLLTATEYAKKFGPSRRTAYNMIQDGRVLSVVIGGIKFILP